VDAASLATLWQRLEPAVEEHARFPPGGLDVSVWLTVAAGRVARPHVDRGALGVGVLPVSLAEAWLAVTDDHPVDAVDGLTQVALRGSWGTEKWLYQRIDLPWPVQDRHWVLHGTSNLALAKASGVWERAWESDPAALATARERVDAVGYDSAATVPVNRGSWLLAPISGHETLGIYRAEADLGGAIPEGAAQAYTASTLDKLYASTARDALSMRTRYATGCTPQPGGDGVPIPCF